MDICLKLDFVFRKIIILKGCSLHDFKRFKWFDSYYFAVTSISHQLSGFDWTYSPWDIPETFPKSVNDISWKEERETLFDLLTSYSEYKDSANYSQ